jgi:hypothetical protein
MTVQISNNPDGSFHVEIIQPPGPPTYQGQEPRDVKTLKEAVNWLLNWFTWPHGDPTGTVPPTEINPITGTKS